MKGRVDAHSIYLALFCLYIFLSIDNNMNFWMNQPVTLVVKGKYKFNTLLEQIKLGIVCNDLHDP